MNEFDTTGNRFTEGNLKNPYGINSLPAPG